jgi:nucleoid-associated protein YgaU
MKSRLPVLVLLFIVLAALPGSAADTPVQCRVLVILKSTTPEEDPDFRSLMLNAIRVEIEDRELTVLEPITQPPNGEQPWQSSGKAGADFALAATYTMRQLEAAFDLAWYDTAEKRQTQAVSRKVSLDFTLDVTIATAIVEILDGQKDRIAVVRSARIEAARAAAEKAAADKAAADKAAAAKAAAERAAIEAAANAKAKEEADRKIAAALKRPVDHWGLIAGAGPFLATVEASEYFTLGLSASLNGQYRFAVPGGLFGIGLATGVNAFRATGTAGEADSMLIPIGATVVYGTNTGSRFDFSAHIDGGAAVFLLTPVVSGITAVGVVPFILGGVGMTIAVFEKAGFIIDASYAAFFPRGVPIMGFSPSLGLFLRL